MLSVGPPAPPSGRARHGGGGRKVKGLAARWSRSSVMAPSPPAWPSRPSITPATSTKDMLVVLNDNEMSISENVGSPEQSPRQADVGKLYTTIREGGKKVLAGLPPVKEARQAGRGPSRAWWCLPCSRSSASSGSIGRRHPCLGRNPCESMRNLKGPQLLQRQDQEGQGYEPAEKDPVAITPLKIQPG